MVGQYYNFLRLGRDGYTTVMHCLSDTAQWLARELAAMAGPDNKQVFEVISDGSAIPVVAFKLVEGTNYTVFDVSALLRSYGWQVPAYTMPDDASDVAVLRIVVREGFSANLARALRDAWWRCSRSWTGPVSAGSPTRSTSPTDPSAATAWDNRGR